MLKDDMLRILDINKELIKNIFSVSDNGIDDIRKFLNKDHNDFKEIVDNIFLSDMGNREKMFTYYLMGYVNGDRVKRSKMTVDK